MTKAVPAWLVPVTAIFILQTTAAFLGRFIPIIAPAMSAEFGWAGSSIGYMATAASLGAFAVLAGGATLLRLMGSMRVLQITLLLGAAGMLFFLNSSVSVALAACLFMGLANGAANPAGSDILQRFSPPGHRNLIFSIKQAGVPLGGVIAGLLVPLLVVIIGWRASIGVCASLVLLATLLTWRVSSRCDQPQATGRWPFSLPRLSSLRALREPLRSLRSNDPLWKISIVGSVFAISQSCWFTFTVIYLIDRLGYSLALAGVVFAVMQAGGVIGRVVLGWLSDHMHSATFSLSMAAGLSTFTTVLLGLSSPGWPVWTIVLLAFVAGASAASWNGVQIAEVARYSPSHLITETAAGSSVLVSIVNMLVPTAFAAFVAVTGRYDYAFIAAGLATLLVFVYLPRHSKP